METLGRLLLMIGPLIVGVVGIPLMVLGASVWQGKKRWLVLFYGPALIVTGMYLILFFASNVLQPQEGSGFLLGGAVLGLSLFGLAIYYPTLCIVAFVRWLKNRKASTS